MSKRITGLIALAAAAVLGIGRSAAAQEPTIVDHHERPHHIFLIGKPHRTVEDAVQACHAPSLNAQVPVAVRGVPR